MGRYRPYFGIASFEKSLIRRGNAKNTFSVDSGPSNDDDDNIILSSRTRAPRVMQPRTGVRKEKKKKKPPVKSHNSSGEQNAYTTHYRGPVPVADAAPGLVRVYTCGITHGPRASNLYGFSYFST